MKYKHFLITRFNLKRTCDSWLSDKFGKEVLTDEWMEERMNLFLGYCLPSVQSQTCKNFIWIIYIDIHTNEKFLNIFKKLENEFDFIRVIQVNNYEEFQSNYCKDILSICDGSCKYIISTRLDNDDVVHKDFIFKIQDSFEFQDFMAVNFLKVLTLNPFNFRKVYIDYQFSNHFISIIEKIKDDVIIGCYSRGDRFWDEKGKILQIYRKPYCVEIISNQNLINDFRGFPVLKKISLVDFNIDYNFKNKLFALENFLVHKMSWKKRFRYWFLYLKDGKLIN